MAVEDSRGIGLFDPCAAVSGILTFPKLPRGRGRKEGRGQGNWQLMEAREFSRRNRQFVKLTGLDAVRVRIKSWRKREREKKKENISEKEM